MQASGDCTHYIFHYNIFIILMMPLGEPMQESGVPGEEECRL